jgi:hypothetical protein
MLAKSKTLEKLTTEGLSVGNASHASPATKISLDDRVSLTRPRTTTELLFEAKFCTAGKEKRHLQNDINVLSFIISNGMVPTRVDSSEWKTLWQTVDPSYKPASSTTIVESHIPHEAGAIHMKLTTFLRDAKNEGFTLSFDGGTTRRVDSVYTIHVTTSDHCVFLWEGHETLAESHTGEHLAKEIKKVWQIFFLLHQLLMQL